MAIKVKNSDNKVTVMVGKQSGIRPSPTPLPNAEISNLATKQPSNVPIPSLSQVKKIEVGVHAGPPGVAGAAGPQGPQGPAGTGGGGGGTYDVLTDLVSGSLAYVGKAAIGSVASNPAWQIQKLVTDINGNITLLWAGQAAFNQIWNNRVNLTYL